MAGHGGSSAVLALLVTVVVAVDTAVRTAGLSMLSEEGAVEHIHAHLDVGE